MVGLDDNPPEFERSVYIESVPEASEVGSSLLQVYATSRDTGVNAQITYSIVDGDAEGLFAIDADYGGCYLLGEKGF